jgi:hypothetical protein
VTDEGLRVPTGQLDALRQVPAEDMLVDPAQLAAVLEEPGSAGSVTRTELMLWTLASLILTIGAAIWWAATGH